MRSFKILKTTQEVEKLRSQFCRKIKYDIPLGYFLKGYCYGFFEDKNLVGGFCLVHDLPSKLRSLQQVPSGPGSRWFGGFDSIGLTSTNVAEFTGYYLNSKKHGLYFTYHLVKTILFHKASRFIYSYPVAQTKLEAYYAKGRPIRIYSGPPQKLAGHLSDMEPEHVEVLTKWGIVKIFMARTLKQLFRF